MFEDANHNRMHEELNLFQQIANNPIFQGIPIFLYVCLTFLLLQVLISVTSADS